MEKIKKLRQEIGMSQKELAEKINVHKSVYSQMESGKLITNYKDEKRDLAIEVMYPRLIKKILLMREEVERLETFSLQFKNQ